MSQKVVAVWLPQPTENKTVTNVVDATLSQTQGAESDLSFDVRHYDQGRYDKAIAEFYQAIVLRPKLKNYNMLL